MIVDERQLVKDRAIGFTFESSVCSELGYKVYESETIQSTVTLNLTINSYV